MNQHKLLLIKLQTVVFATQVESKPKLKEKRRGKSIYVNIINAQIVTSLYVIESVLLKILHTY